MDIDIHLGAQDFEKITVSDTAVGLTASKLSPSGKSQPLAALITVETAACRIRVDGTDPTADVGHLLSSGDSIVIHGADNLGRFRAIRSTGTDSDLFITYLSL